MTRMRSVFASLLFSAGCASCSSAYADQPTIGPQPPPGYPQTAIAIANAKVRAPYDVEVIREGGETSPTFAQKDRFYVQGNAGERYTIRITNPTARRVEAVVTVDGLDVIDGENGDLRKRGYIVPAGGEVRIEGFRTSQADVATFRFSSVNDSYAGQKGKARNVGVIAAAIFEEDAPVEQQIITTAIPRPDPRPYDYRNDLDGRRGEMGPPPPPTKSDRVSVAPNKAPMPASESRAPSGGGAPAHVRQRDDGEGADAPAPQTNRPGLGTEYGEQRYSAASYTHFNRANSRPIAVAELRYNDASGLMALGIPVAPLPDSGEIMTRETADPFPGDHFARPPGR